VIFSLLTRQSERVVWACAQQPRVNLGLVPKTYYYYFQDHFAKSTWPLCKSTWIPPSSNNGVWWWALFFVWAIVRNLSLTGKMATNGLYLTHSKIREKPLPHYRGIWTIFTYSSTLVVMIKFGRGAVGPIACSVQPGRPADNSTAAYGLLYAWKNQLQSCQNGTWTGGKLKIWCFFSPLPSFTLSLYLLPLSLSSL